MSVRTSSLVSITMLLLCGRASAKRGQCRRKDGGNLDRFQAGSLAIRDPQDPSFSGLKQWAEAQAGRDVNFEIADNPESGHHSSGILLAWVESNNCQTLRKGSLKFQHDEIWLSQHGLGMDYFDNVLYHNGVQVPQLYPLGFDNFQAFCAFVKGMLAHLPQITTPTSNEDLSQTAKLAFVGSSVMGVSYRYKGPNEQNLNYEQKFQQRKFDQGRTSDFDLGIVSPTLFNLLKKEPNAQRWEIDSVWTKPLTQNDMEALDTFLVWTYDHPNDFLALKKGHV